MAGSIPAVIAIIAWGTAETQQQAVSHGVAARVLWEIMSWNILLWLASLVWILISLVIFPSFRSAAIRKITGVKERDEREVGISENAGKKSLFLQCALLILFLFAGMLEVTLVKLPADKAVDGKRHQVSVGFHFNLYMKENRPAYPEGYEVRAYHYPFSHECSFLFILLCGAGAYAFFSRKRRL